VVLERRTLAAGRYGPERNTSANGTLILLPWAEREAFGAARDKDRRMVRALPGYLEEVGTRSSVELARKDYGSSKKNVLVAGDARSLVSTPVEPQDSGDNWHLHGGFCTSPLRAAPFLLSDFVNGRCRRRASRGDVRGPGSSRDAGNVL